MKRVVLSCVAALSPLALAFASIPPEIPPNRMPTAQRPNVPIPPIDELPAIPDPLGAMTLERLKHITVSGVLYKALYDQATAALPTASLNTPASGGTTVTATADRWRAANVDTRVASRGATHLRLQADANGGSTANATNDQPQDVEPTTVSVNIGGTQHTATVTTKYVPCWNNAGNLCPTLFAYHTTNLNTYSGQQLPIPIGRPSRTYIADSMGDPLIAVNPYTGGVWGKRMYCSSILFWNGTPQYTASNWSEVVVWHSDDGGATWSGAALVDQALGGGLVMDKPAITVSWQQGASLGYVYVTYIVVNTNDRTQNQLRVAVSTNGGSTFTPVTVTTDNVQFPQVVVDAQGTVNPLWVRLLSNQIQTTQSYDNGNSYVNAATNGPFDIVSSSFVVHDQTVPGFATNRANSVLMARYNWTAQRIGLVYYGQPSPGANYQVYYTFKPGCSSCNPAGWPQIPTAVTSSANDHFNAALDYNKSAGNWVIPYYRSSGTAFYDEYFSYVTANGVVQQSEVRISPTTSRADQQTTYPGFIGDYQDIWDDYFPTEEAVTAWIGIGISPNTSTTNGDDCQTQVTY